MSQLTPASKKRIADPVLGEVFICQQSRAWVADVPIGEQTIAFVLAGDDCTPSEAALAHARDIVQSFPTFHRMIVEFLGKEAQEYPNNSDEIEQLRIAYIGLPFSTGPRDGGIGFTGPSDIRIWHCRYVDGKPVSLGFDD